MDRLSKLILGAILLASTMFAGDIIASPNEKYKITTTDIRYLYNYPLKKCEETTFKEKANFINGIRSEEYIITEKYVNDVGITYIVNYEYKGSEFKIGLMNNYGECRLYEDTTVKNKNVKAKDYVNLGLGK